MDPALRVVEGTEMVGVCLWEQDAVLRAGILSSVFTDVSPSPGRVSWHLVDVRYHFLSYAGI